MNTTPRQTSARRAVRAVTTLTSLGVLGSAVLLTAPAHATGTPEGWSDPEPVGALHAIALLVGGPLVLGLLVALAVYLPALARGEKVTPGEPESEWFGGPRQGVSAADGVDTAALEGKDTGGASGRW